jgi:hypothetical protein
MFYNVKNCLIRLWAPSQATDARRNKVFDVVIADPYLMNEENL